MGVWGLGFEGNWPNCNKPDSNPNTTTSPITVLLITLLRASWSHSCGASGRLRYRYSLAYGLCVYSSQRILIPGFVLVDSLSSLSPIHKQIRPSSHVMGFRSIFSQLILNNAWNSFSESSRRHTHIFPFIQIFLTGLDWKNIYERILTGLHSRRVCVCVSFIQILKYYYVGT